ncbi:MAG: D-alanyl-D-alanine carboxypeptidase/D-alanyl-D-alanine-endopeptidase [Ignavibacteriae bacterium]|nr:D-alanyl-D-alanine carboxypeptidase/D-alanyl-D-alanine-endopeptidase [Ignavibacteriota bacterium]MCB9217260.1 D-alanyl-D-alanine carboxypeptidase/D-alanyl-D-alanine-endopeptidase [Ignavibacteria bacterium]
MMKLPMQALAGLLSLLLFLIPTHQNFGQSKNRVVRSSNTSSGAIDSSAALNNLATDIRSLLTMSSELKSGSVGIRVVSLRNGKSLFDLNSEKPLTPASTTKLLTTYSALLLFGSDYEIPTILYGAVKPEKGIIKGDLFIKGHGDPLFSVGDIDELIVKLKSAGVKRIEGDVVGDGTYFDSVYERKDYSGDADHVVDLPPVAALGIENNMVTVVVSSSRTAGQLCNVQTFPPSSGFVIANSAKSYAASKKKSTTKKKRRRRSSLEEYIPDQSIPKASIGRFGDEEYFDEGRENVEEGIAISLTTDEDGRQTIHVSGTLGVNKTVSKRYEIKNPPAVVAGMFFDRLRTNGIEITGAVRTGATLQKAVPLAEFRRPLTQVINTVMKQSHNHYAEYVFKMIGAASGSGKGENATATQARAAIRQCMEASSAPFESCVVNDGSGLSRRNLISPQALVATLVAAYNNRPLWKALYEALSVAGKDGTLRKRMKGTRAEGNVHGKTGTLKNVSALTGYVTSADGEMLAFAMITNGYNVGTYKSVENKVAERLADFSWNEGKAVPE